MHTFHIKKKKKEPPSQSLFCGGTVLRAVEKVVA